MRLSVFAAAALLACSLSAHADTIFNFNGALGYGSLSGTVTLNGDSTSFSAADLTFVDGGNTQEFTTIEDEQQITPDVFQLQLIDSSDDDVYLRIPTNSLMTYGGGPVCSGANVCDGTISSSVLFVSPLSQDGLNDGSLTPVSAIAATPEPSSIALLTTGVLGLVGAGRKRLA